MNVYLPAGLVVGTLAVFVWVGVTAQRAADYFGR